MSFINLRAHRVNRTLNHRAEPDRLKAQFDLALRDARDIEQVIDQSGHMADLPIEHLHRAPLRRFGLKGSGEQARGIAHRRQRVTQLMGQHRQELILAAVGLAKEVKAHMPLGLVDKHTDQPLCVQFLRDHVEMHHCPHFDPALSLLG